MHEHWDVRNVLAVQAGEQFEYKVTCHTRNTLTRHDGSTLRLSYRSPAPEMSTTHIVRRKIQHFLRVHLMLIRKTLTRKIALEY